MFDGRSFYKHTTEPKKTSCNTFVITLNSSSKHLRTCCPEQEKISLPNNRTDYFNCGISTFYVGILPHAKIHRPYNTLYPTIVASVDGIKYFWYRSPKNCMQPSASYECTYFRFFTSRTIKLGAHFLLISC